MSTEISYAHVAFDLLANEFVELAAAFRRRDAELGEDFLTQAQERLAVQFDGLRNAFQRAGLEKEYSALLSQAKGIIDSVITTASASQVKVTQ